MLKSTLSRLVCPGCAGTLEWGVCDSDQNEVRFGRIRCTLCELGFPVLAGVGILVENSSEYILQHVKGIAELVPDSEIPEEIRADFEIARSEIEVGHIEDDLEAERVNALYLMNHYLDAASDLDAAWSARSPWWMPQPGQGEGSPLIDSLVRQYWDQGPLSEVERRVRGLAESHKTGRLDCVELGCGVGGLGRRLAPWLGAYLGVDSAFKSIALARHLVLGAEYLGEIRVPEDLLQGPVSRRVDLRGGKAVGTGPGTGPSTAQGTPEGAGAVDFVVGDLEAPPVAGESFDLALSLNTIDMLEDPRALPRLQYAVLRAGGTAIQSCPYIWHSGIAQALRESLPEGIRESSRAVEHLYREAGFEIGESLEHLPWLFFKHVRQLEIYSVHLFSALK